jgi:methylmalonyl-CoA/ethylmalonyl-CoA epimerase
LAQNSAVKKIDHIGISVRDMKKAKAMYVQLSGATILHEEFLEQEQLHVAFLQLGDTSLELLQPVNEDSNVGKFIAKRGEGIHHIAYEVADIRAEMARLKKSGFQLITEEPYMGARNKLVCFLHPKSTGGVLTELCQKQS